MKTYHIFIWQPPESQLQSSAVKAAFSKNCKYTIAATLTQFKCFFMETTERHSSNNKVSHFIKFQVSIKAKQNIFKTSEQSVTMLPEFFKSSFLK